MTPSRILLSLSTVVLGKISAWHFIKGHPTVGVYVTLSAFIVDLLWNPYVAAAVITCAILATLCYSLQAARPQSRQTDEPRWIVLGMLICLTSILWHRNLWFCNTVRAPKEDGATLMTPFIVGFVIVWRWGRTPPSAHRCIRWMTLLVQIVTATILVLLMSPWHNFPVHHHISVGILVVLGTVQMLHSNFPLSIGLILVAVAFGIYQSIRGGNSWTQQYTTILFFVYHAQGLLVDKRLIVKTTY